MATITYTIPEGKLAAFKIGFLKECPVPIDNDGEPVYTENAWIKEWGKQQFKEKYKRGMRRIASEAAIVDDDIIN